MIAGFFIKAHLTNAWPKYGHGQFLCILLHHILSKHFGVGICIRISLYDCRRQRIQRVLVQALSQLEGIVASHWAVVKLLLDVPHIAVGKCGRDMHESLRIESN